MALLTILDSFLLAWMWDRPATFDDIQVPVIVMFGLFVAVEWRVIHVQFQAEASSFSLLEVPMVLGLLYVPPAVLVLAVLVGGTIGLKFGRGQSWLKVLFNTANISLYVLLAVAMIQATASAHPTDRVSWAAVFLATSVGSLANMVIIMAAITLTDAAPQRRKVVELILFGLVVTMANTAVGLAASLLALIDILSVLLLVGPGALMLLALRVFASERAQRERVEFLYRSTRHLDLTGSDDGLITLLNEAREMFKAEVGAVLLIGNDADITNHMVHCSDVANRSAPWPGNLDPALVERAFETLSDPIVVKAGSAHSLAAVVEAVGGREGMVATLATDERNQGLLVVANRRGQVTTFTGEDLQVLGALARQSAVLLHSDQLEQALIELQKLERRLAHQATHDSLTGLPNRALFDSQLDEATASSDPFTVLFIDLDDFKIVNDTHGHAAGDQVLNAVARRLESLVRPDDTVARLGGDEFAVLLRSAVQPKVLADRIVSRISEDIDIDEGRVRVGCSIGLARATEGTATSQLLRDADHAMYQAKQAGKGAAVEGTPPADTPAPTTDPGPEPPADTPAPTTDPGPEPPADFGRPDQGPAELPPAQDDPGAGTRAEKQQEPVTDATTPGMALDGVARPRPSKGRPAPQHDQSSARSRPSQSM